MSKVASELGVATQSLYRHVASRGELVSLCVNELVMRWVPVEEQDQSTEDWLFEYATNTRTLLLDHPGLAVELQTIGPGTPQIIHLAEQSIGAMVQRGFPVLISYLLIGSVAESTIAGVIRQQRFLQPSTGEDVATLITLEAIKEVDPELIPHIASITDFLVTSDGDRYFSFTTRSLIDGMLRRLADNAV
jgi:AcrR family transcriptional regulator